MGKKYGITDLDALKKRCQVDPDSGCWTWGGAQVALAHRPLQVWLPHLGRTQSIQRAAWILARGPIKQGRIVWCTCGTQDCANPRHLASGTKAAHGAYLAKRGHLRGLPARRIINRQNIQKSGQTRLTMELAQWVRESDQVGLRLAEILGVSKTAISRVRRGQCYAPIVANSVFSWAGMGR